MKRFRRHNVIHTFNVKRALIIIVLALVVSACVAAQSGIRLPVVGVAADAAAASGETNEALASVARELQSWGTMTVVTGADAERAEYLIRVSAAREGGNVVLRSVTIDTRTRRTLTEARAAGASLALIPMETFCTTATAEVPFPNFLLGRWRSVVDMIDGPLTCILEFRSDRSVRVQQFDTWEHNGSDSLRYQGIGSGTYTYAGYRRRTVNLGGRNIEADATVGIALTLEDALPKYEAINSGGMRVLFNSSFDSFSFVYGAIPCGDNFSGPRIHPSAEVFYTRFTKIQ